MLIKRAVVPLVFSLVLMAASVGLSGQVIQLTDAGAIPASATLVEFDEAVSGAPAADLYLEVGVRFMGDGEGVPEIRTIVTIPTIPPFTDRVLRNATPEGAAGNGALLIHFSFPVRRAGMNLSNGDAMSSAALEAFSPAGQSLGTVTQEGLADLPGVFLGVETTSPQGISILRLSYDGDDPEEQIQDLRFELLTPRPFVVYLPQVASGSAVDLSIETVVQVQNLLGGSATTRVDFFNDDGEPMEVTADGEAVTSLEFGLPRKVSRVFHIASGGPLQSGYARVESDRPVLAQAVYSVFRDGRLVDEAGIDSTSARYTQVSSFELASGLELGLAVVNPGEAAVFVVLTVTDQAVNDIVQASFFLEPGQHRAFFISDALESIDADSFRGTVEVTASQPVAVTGLRTRAGLPSASLATGSTER